MRQRGRYLDIARFSESSHLRQEDILITNDTPPRACLADFGFTTVVFDPQNPVSWSPTLEGGVVAFTAPELIVPPKFGLSDSTPTQEGDIYAFGFVILQVKHCTIATSFFLNGPLGPDGGATVLRCPASRTYVLRCKWKSSR